MAELIVYKIWNTLSCLQQIPTKLNTRCWKTSSFIVCVRMNDLKKRVAEFQEHYITMAIYIELRK